MIRIAGIIDEIKSFRKDTNHRSALQIVRLLEGNQKLFLEKMEAADFNFLLRNFEELSQTHPKNYNSDGFIRDFEKNFESLLFHLNKIA